MLIVSIPKSASTSILKTLSNLHQLDGSQLLFKDYKIPPTFKLLGKYHSDLREFQSSDVNIFLQNNRVYKQHIPPTKNNLNLLMNKKKVILLRNPEDIIMAYYRANKKLLHEKRKEFKDVHNHEEWFQTAIKIGLFKELNDFYNGWETINDEKLIIYYSDLIENQKKTINIVEEYLDLKVTEKKIFLAKERYSRGSWIYTFPRLIKKYTFKYLKTIMTKN